MLESQLDTTDQSEPRGLNLASIRRDKNSARKDLFTAINTALIDYGRIAWYTIPFSLRLMKRRYIARAKPSHPCHGISRAPRRCQYPELDPRERVCCQKRGHFLESPT
jgi:hypothetical protein